MASGQTEGRALRHITENLNGHTLFCIVPHLCITQLLGLRLDKHILADKAQELTYYSISEFEEILPTLLILSVSN